MRTRIILGIFLVVLTACYGGSFDSKVQKQLEIFLASHDEINATYKITHNDEVIIEGAQGFANREESVKLVENQKMPIASGTKQMTASLILKLQEKGILSVHDTLAKFLTENSGWWPNNKMPDWASKVTFHHLLTHTSGIAEYIPALKFDINQSHDKIKHLITEYAANTPLNGEPGANYNYSNTGYVFLGLVIETVMNKDLASIFKEEFFDPIEMNDSHMASLDEAIKFQQDKLEGYPRTYFGIPTGSKPQFVRAKVDFYLVPFSDGGVISTVSDLIKWDKAFHNGKVVSDYSYKLMTTPYNLAHDVLERKVSTGYGVYISELPDGQLSFYHQGKAVGIRSEHGYIPNSKVYFAMLSNVMIYEPEEIAGKVNYTETANQFDTGFLRNALFDAVSVYKK